MNQDELKRLVAQAACAEVLKLPPGQNLGIGTGTTANWFIDLLTPHKDHFSGVVSSSIASADRLKKNGFKVLEASQITHLPAYVDGADEIDPAGHMIKGGGGALTREKIVAAMAQHFICICDASKQVQVLGNFPLPVEIIPLAHAYLTQKMTEFGGEARLRTTGPQGKPYVTDNGGWILDVHGLKITQPQKLELEINQLAGVVTVGLFAKRKANLLLVAKDTSVETVTYK